MVGEVVGLPRLLRRAWQPRGGGCRLSRTQVTRLWHVALERRSQRTRISWKRMDRLAHDGSHLPVSCTPFPTCDSAFVPKAGAQEALAAPAGICAGGRPKGRSLPR